MAKERQDVSVNLSTVPKEPYGAPEGGDPSPSSPSAMPVEPEDTREATPTPSSTAPCPVGTSSVTPEEVPAGGAEALKSPSVKSKSPPESSSSSSPDSEPGVQYQSRYKGKEFPMPLSPESSCRVKRRLWDVDRKEVDESLSRELKRFRQEESVVKSSKWNFDFEKDLPLSGTWAWEKSESLPSFYQEKEYPKKKHSQLRYSPYERSGGSSEAVSSTFKPTTSSASLVTSARELSSLRATVSSSSTSEASTKERVESSVEASSEESDTTHDIKGLPSSSSLPEQLASALATSTCSSTVSSTLDSASKVDICDPDYFKQTSKRLRTEDDSKSSSSSSSDGSGGVSSNNNNGSSSVTSFTPQGLIPSQFYSRESDQSKEPLDRGPECSTTDSSKNTKPSEKRKRKTPTPSSSGTTSPSPLLKYYR